MLRAHCFTSLLNSTNDFMSLDHLRLAIRNNECPEDFDKISSAHVTSAVMRSRVHTDSSGSASSLRFSSNAASLEKGEPYFGSCGSGVGGPINSPSIVQPPTSPTNAFQWIQNSQNISNLPPSAPILNQGHIKKAWNVSECHSTADWDSWFKHFVIEFIRESPSPFLKTCAGLAQTHFPFARELFQAAFVSCWKELCEENQESLIASLLVAMQADKFPSDILLVFLNLAEFMEHDVNALPIEPHVLAGLAEKSLAFAKALHYRELEFQTSPASSFESLININKKLNMYDGAMGVLCKVQKMNAHKEEGRLKEDMLMSLEKWTEALEVNEKKLEVAPFNKVAMMNKIKCLTNLGRWEEALDILTQRADYLAVSNNSKKVSIWRI